MRLFFHLLLLLLISNFSSYAQVLQPASWEHEASTREAKIGEEIEIIFKAALDNNWYLYSSDFDPDCGPIVATFDFVPDESYALVGGIRPINPTKKHDEIFGCDVTIFKKQGEFRQTIKVLSDNLKIAGNYEYQVCSDIDGKCITFDEDFAFTDFDISAANGPKALSKDPKGPEEKKSSPVDNSSQNEKQDKNAEIQKPLAKPIAADTASIDPTINQYSEEFIGPIFPEELKAEKKKDDFHLLFMLGAFLAGLAALLTPCVFPMIPMTVSYFTGKKKGWMLALVYGFSIVIIYSIIGSLIAPLMGPETANDLSTEWLPNIIFFLVFFIFALSFFGLFDITLPSSFVNKIDSKADRGGLLGVFFMAFTLVLVSFSCTGPIVGSILVASAGGEFVKPILGMLAFSLAFAIPFTLFAIFPGWLSNLPKSGGWLNSVKVVLGFIELALAFKFLSIADQAFHWGILDRDLNIAIWIAIFSLMGFYLLGKIQLPHDSKTENIGVGRLILAIATFSFVIYLIPGLWGAPLKGLAGYLPPMHTHDFDLISATRPADQINYGECEKPKYSDFLHLPHGLNGYFDYEQAMACARAVGKPLFIDFTGHGCTNCREMEAVVWSDPAVLERLKNDFVVVALYVDDKTELPESEWYTSTYDNKIKKTIGKQNADLQITKLNNNAQPFYVIVGKDERVLVEPQSYDTDIDDFVKFLEEGKQRYIESYQP